MAAFFEFPLEREANAADIVAMAWNKINPILSVAESSGAILLYQEEGGRPYPFPSPRQYPATTLAWTPKHNVLAIGSAEGGITLWAVSDNKVSTMMDAHIGPVTFLEWTPDSSRLISAAKDGSFSVKKWDKKRGISNSNSYRVNEPITHCLYRSDVSSGAFGNAVGLTFYIATESGRIFVADEFGQLTEATNIGSPLAVMLLHEEAGMLIAVTTSLNLIKFKIAADGTIARKSAVRLSSETNGFTGIWTQPGLLTTVAGESMIRFWNQSANENYVLTLSSVEVANPVNADDRITCIAFSSKKQFLAAGTAEGKVVLWRYIGGLSSTASSDWEAMSVVNVGSSVLGLVWGTSSGLLAARTQTGGMIVVHSSMQHALRNGIAAVQCSRKSVAVERGNTQAFVESSIRVKRIDVTDNRVCVSNDKTVEVYTHQQGGSMLEGQFDMNHSAMALYDDTVYLIQEKLVLACGPTGTVKQRLQFTESEGKPLLMDICGSFLAVYTDASVLKLWDVGHREAKPMSLGKKFEEKTIGEVVSIRINSRGNRIAMLMNATPRPGTVLPDTKLYVYEVDQDIMRTHEFGPDKYPTFVCWDVTEPKLLAAETALIRGRVYVEDSGKKRADKGVVTLFSTPDSGLIVQDQFDLDETTDNLLGLHVPYIYLGAKPAPQQAGEERLSTGKRSISRTMRDFIGMESADEATRSALMDFSYYLTIGNMDEAFKAVKLIKSNSVWENMAHMCVKTQRLEIAEVCLGNMGHARGARAVREAKKEPEVPAQVAMVAVQLGLLDDAERLYMECGRYDLLNTLYQASNQWEKAVEVARKNDRIHLGTTFYNFGKYLESIGDFPSAIQAFERSDTHRTEIPRMLRNDLPQLQKYVETSDDAAIKRWWGQFAEANNALDRALICYGQAKDYRSYVRVLCMHGNFARAVEICTETSHPAACFHLAQQLEQRANGDISVIREAIKFYSLSGRFGHAITLARQGNLDGDLLQLALQSTKPHMIEAATYFEERGQMDKAVNLYDKGGWISKAVDLCFRTEQFELLRDIAAKLDKNTDPELLARCASFFTQHQQFDKAVQLLVAAGQPMKALDMAVANNVAISEDMAEAMTPAQPKEGKDPKARDPFLMRLAEYLRSQGSYATACKKFTQAGDKVSAIKCLLKLGDVDKIVFYTNMSKSAEVCVLTANYLQSKDWRQDQNLRKSIIQYYTKAKALDALGRFYVSVAEVDVDEDQNYEQAAASLKEAVECLGKTQEGRATVPELQARIGWIERFLEARTLLKSNPDEMVRICQELLQDPNIETAVRAGDVFELLITLAYTQADYQQAYRFIEMMQQRRIPLKHFLERAMVERICQAVGVTLGRQEQPVADTVDEEVPE